MREKKERERCEENHGADLLGAETGSGVRSASALSICLSASSKRSAGGAVDICASGVKLRNADSSQNTGTMIYAAWAAHPLGAKRVTPATAR